MLIAHQRRRRQSILPHKFILMHNNSDRTLDVNKRER